MLLVIMTYYNDEYPLYDTKIFLKIWWAWNAGTDVGTRLSRSEDGRRIVFYWTGPSIRKGEEEGGQQ